MRLLLIEDVQLTADVTLRQLVRFGFSRVDHAESGEDALILMQRHTYDIVLLDWNLPGMSGLELLFLMRASRRYATTPVLMVSGRAGRADIQEALSAGATDFLAKPAPPSALEAKLHGFLPAFA